MKLLHVDSGILGATSVSRRLSAAAVAQWRDQHPETTLVYRDLVSDPVDHLTGELLAARNTNPSQHPPAVRQALAVGEKVLDEFLAADVVVVGAPMYNFGIPSQLKAWIDRLAVAGKTFAYTAKGPVGLVEGKTVINLAFAVAVAVELGGGLLLVVGYHVRPIAFALAVFSVVAAVSFHSNFADHNQMIHFLKDVMLTGGLLQIVAFGPGAISVEQWRRKIGTPSGAEAITV
jgi:FMN-dependent NADH-azoreductase